MVGFLTETGPTYIVGSLSPVDQHVTFTISDVHAPQKGRRQARPIIGSPSGLQRHRPAMARI